jgi:predicted nucleic acid-binding protein
MAISTTFLPDVNVWLALPSRGHVHAAACGDWLNSMESEVIFCRVTQVGLLRLRWSGDGRLMY